MRRHLLLVGALAGALASAACEDDPAAPAAGSLSAAEAESLALDIDESALALLDAELSADGAIVASPSDGAVPGPYVDLITTDIDFTRTRTCPLGGDVELEGSMHRVRDTETNELTVTFEADKTHRDCAYAIPVGSITLNGAPNIHIEGNRHRVNRVPVGLQTTTYDGAFSWEKSEGSQGTCVVDITSTLDPEAHTRTVTGTFCGRVVNRTVTWRVDVSVES